MSAAVLWADIASLYQEFRPSIFGHIYYKLGKFGTSQEAVEDLTEQVFLQAIEAFCAGHGPVSHARGWLFRIAHNLCIDEYRRRSRRGTAIDFDDLVEMAQAGLTPHDQLVSDVGCELIWSCINQLKDEQEEAIMLHMEGYSDTELATRTGIGDSAVKGRLHRGRARLAKMLSEAQP